MGICYKYFEDKNLYIEVGEGDITLDTLAAYFLELEHSVDMNKVQYVYSDFSRALLNFSDIQIQQITTSFLAFSQEYDFKKWAYVYPTDSKAIQVTKDSFKDREFDFIKFFTIDQKEESFDFIENDEIVELINSFLYELNHKDN